MEKLCEHMDVTNDSSTERMDEGSSCHCEKDNKSRHCTHMSNCQRSTVIDQDQFQIQPNVPITNRTSDSPVIKSIPDDESHAPVPSVLSMKSDRSKGLPENFRGDFTQDFTQIHFYQPNSSSILTAETSDISVEEISTSYHHPVANPENVRCDLCSKKAVESCLTCIASFCEPHVKPHYTAPALQRHKLVEATADLEQRLCQHHNKILDLFCLNDNKPVCALCSVEKHKGHEIIPNQVDQDLIQVHHMNELEWIIREDIPTPGPIKVTSVKPDAVSLSWGSPKGLTGPQRFRVSVKCSRSQRSLEVQGSKIDIEGLTPQVEYECMVATICGQGNQSTWVSESICTEVPAPKWPSLTGISTTSISLRWRQPAGLDQASYLVTLKKSDECLQTISTEALECSFSDLQPATKYTIEFVTVFKIGYQSKSAVESYNTDIPAPENLKVEFITPTTANLRWSLSNIMDQTPHNFLIRYTSKESKQEISTDSCSVIITDLKPYTECDIRISTNVENVGKSQEAYIDVLTGIPPVTHLITESVHSTAVALGWNHGERPSSKHECHYQVSYHSDESDLKSVTTKNLNCLIKGLKLMTEYVITVTAIIIKDGEMSEPASTSYKTGLPSPGPMQFTSVMPYWVSLSWAFPEGLTDSPQFQIIWCQCSGKSKINRCLWNSTVRSPSHLIPRRLIPVTLDIIEDSKQTTSHMIVKCSHATIDGLRPGTNYDFCLSTISETGVESQYVTASIKTAIPAPKDVLQDLEDLSLTWNAPPGEFGESRYQLSFFRAGECFKTVYTNCLTCPLSDLDFETEYTIQISTLWNGGSQTSQPMSERIYIEIPVPQDFHVASVTATSACLSWKLYRGMGGIPHSFLISYHSRGAAPETFRTDSHSMVIAGLKPDTEYTVGLSTTPQRGGCSKQVSTVFKTALPAPGPIQFTSVSSNAVSLCWGAPEGLTTMPEFCVTCTEKMTGKIRHLVVSGRNISFEDLMPGEEYDFTVATVDNNKRQSSSVLATKYTEVPVPESVTGDRNGKTAKVSWSKPAGLAEVSYLLTLCSDKEHDKIVYTKVLWCLFPELQFDTEYTVSISCVLPNGRQSKSVSEVIHQRKKPRVD